MTKRKNRRGQETNLLKAILLTSTIAATILGTGLLASKDDQVVAANQSAVPQIIENRASSTITNLPDGAVIIDLQPVPQAFSPNIQPVQRVRPVARTRTS